MFSVLHIINKFDLSQGGPPRSINNIINGLKSKGIKTYLISTSKRKIIKNNNFFYIGINLFDRFSFPNLSLIIHIRKKIKEYDLIHIHCMWNFITTISFFFATYYKKKIIFSPHGTMDKNNIKNNYFLKKIFYFLIEKRNIKKIDIIHYLSNEEKKNSLYLSGKNFFIINNGINIEKFKSIKKKKLKIFNPNKFNILNIGRFNKIKGLDLQLDLIKKANKEKNIYRLILVGPNDNDKYSFISKVKKMGLKKSVSFMAPVYSDKRFEIMRSSDLVINTSFYECNSMTILEALACGGLVLAVDNANVNHQSKYGALVKTKRNLNALLKELKNIKKYKKKQLKIRKNAINYSKNFLDINILTIKYIEQYKKLINLNYEK